MNSTEIVTCKVMHVAYFKTVSRRKLGKSREAYQGSHNPVRIRTRYLSRSSLQVYPYINQIGKYVKLVVTSAGAWGYGLLTNEIN
jgi:hypothetical protein